MNLDNFRLCFRFVIFYLVRNVLCSRLLVFCRFEMRLQGYREQQLIHWLSWYQLKSLISLQFHRKIMWGSCWDLIYFSLRMMLSWKFHPKYMRSRLIHHGLDFYSRCLLDQQIVPWKFSIFFLAFPIKINTRLIGSKSIFEGFKQYSSNFASILQ